jgi:hypothetical protein
MGRLKQLAEDILKVVGTKDLVDSEPYRQAIRFLRDGVMPNGQGYADGPPRMIAQLGDAEGCELVRISQASQGDGSVRFEARFSIHPSRASGAGLSIDGAITEFFMAMVEKAPCDDNTGKVALAAALRAECDERTSAIQQAFAGLLVPDELVWRLVGWPQRGAWIVEGVDIDRIAFGDAWVEENRGETWLAKHWEIWVPVTLDVIATMRRR